MKLTNTTITGSGYHEKAAWRARQDAVGSEAGIMEGLQCYFQERKELIPSTLSKLEALHDWLKIQKSFKFVSSSLLFVSDETHIGL